MSENDATAGAMYRTVFDVLGEGLMVWARTVRSSSATRPRPRSLVGRATS